MAEGGTRLDSAKFSCSICQNLLKDPVTIPCGHSYCCSCIKSHWDGEDDKGIYSCPLCREEFMRRPYLKKNIILADLVEDVKKTRFRAAATDLCYAGPDEVACDVCTGRKLKAVKFCLVCLASFCEQHLQHHYKAAPLKKHKLVHPSEKLQEMICCHHNEVMEIFCRTDQQCICYLCMMDQHRGHETVLAAAERGDKQRELEENRLTIRQRIEERENEVELLQQQIEAINVSIDEAVEHSEQNFSQMIRLIQKRSREVKRQLRSQQQTAVNGVRDLLEKLEQEITQLKRKDVQLEQLSQTGDHNQFLHSYPSVSALSEPTHCSSIHTAPLRYFEDVAAAVSESIENLQDILCEIGTNVPARASEEELSLAQPETRAHFLRYSRQLHMDPNTAHRRLVLSDRNRKVTLTAEDQPYPDHPDRFTDDVQVLSRESLTGRCYWEVELRGRVDIAVTYKNICRSGSYNECVFGCNDYSWILCCVDDRFRFRHNNEQTHIAGPLTSRIGVYLDHRAGILSFYSVSDSMVPLYRVQTSFSQPLHVGLCLLFAESAEFIKPQ